MRKGVLFLIIGVLIVGVLSFVFMQGAKVGGTKAVMQMRAQAVTPYVRAGKPTPRTITDNTRFIAIVKPLNAVDVKTQVAGTIEEVLFTDGQFVEDSKIYWTLWFDGKNPIRVSNGSTFDFSESAPQGDNTERQRFVTFRNNEFLQKDKPIAEPSAICTSHNKFNRRVHPLCFL